jgi:hypothetical protein
MRIVPYRILLFFARTWTILATTLIIYSALYLPEAAESTDYVMTFYVAGHLAASGRATDLYPETNVLSFTGSPFDKAAHALLPHLPHNLTAAYMHSPLVAWIFSPLSRLAPNLSLLLWQGLSLVGLAICCGILAHVHDTKTSDILFLSFLLFPIFITLWIGQLSIVFGLLPLCTGFLLLMKSRPFLAGLAWSFVSLKPQYLPAVGLVGTALALAGRPHCLVGLVLGSAALLLANLVIFPQETTLKWLASFRAADASYSSGFYNVPIHLITSLPSNLLMLFPVDQRAALKLPLYALAAGLWLIALWQCWRLARTHLDQRAKILLMGLLAVVLLPLVPPHMLYYDLGLFLPSAIALRGRRPQMPEEFHLRRLTLIISTGISLYFPFFLSLNPNAALPLGLVSLFLACFIVILAMTNRISRASRMLL